ncbi:MAG TPA: VOC family protein, partial [Patescibacteria group bacterium]
VKHMDFTLEGEQFGAMDSAYEHKFTFNEAISFMVHCETQEEIDYYWDKLTAVPESEQCGWLKDKYGVSWQIVPNAMDRMFADGDQEKIARVTEAFLKMKKFDLAKLEAAAEGK